MKDNEIIKALECCSINGCKNCKYKGKAPDCMTVLQKDTIDLINRQQAEIEELKKENKDLAKRLSDADSVKLTVEYWEQSIKSEAIKEFAEKLKEKATSTFYEERKYVDTEDIDTLVKEMTE